MNFTSSVGNFTLPWNTGTRPGYDAIAFFKRQNFYDSTPTGIPAGWESTIGCFYGGNPPNCAFGYPTGPGAIASCITTDGGNWVSYFVATIYDLAGNLISYTEVPTINNRICPALPESELWDEASHIAGGLNPLVPDPNLPDESAQCGDGGGSR